MFKRVSSKQFTDQIFLLFIYHATQRYGLATKLSFDYLFIHYSANFQEPLRMLVGERW